MTRIHDHLVLGYQVDGRARRLVLHTEDPHQPEPRARVEVVFTGVEAYHLSHDPLAGSLVLDLVETPLPEVVARHRAELEAGLGEDGWPRFWDSDPERLRARLVALEADGVRGFELSSSIGMQGWVLARSLTYAERR